MMLIPPPILSNYRWSFFKLRGDSTLRDDLKVIFDLGNYLRHSFLNLKIDVKFFHSQSINTPVVAFPKCGLSFSPCTNPIKYLNLFHLFLCRQREVRIVTGRAELIPGHHEEYKCRHLFKHLIQPGVLKQCQLILFLSLPPDGFFLYMSAQIAFKELYICKEIPTWTEIVHKYTNYLKRNCIWKGTVTGKELYLERSCTWKGTVPWKELYQERNCTWKWTKEL